MAEEIAALGIVVDASTADQAKPKLDALAQSGVKLENQSNKVTKATREQATALAESGRAATTATSAVEANTGATNNNEGSKRRSRATTDALASAEAQWAAITKTATGALQNATGAANGLASAENNLAAATNNAAGATANMAASEERLANATGNLASFVPRLSGMYQQQTAAINSMAASVPRLAVQLEGIGGTIGKVGAASKSSAHLVTNMGFQLNDVATQAALGQNPFRILAAQGGQFVQIMQQAGGPTAMLKLMGAALGPVGIAAVAVGTALATGFAVATQQINKTHGDLTKGMNLSAEQLERVGNHYVSFGDTIKATFAVAWERIKGGFGGVLKAIGDGYQWAVDKSYSFIQSYIGVWVGGFRAIKEAYKSMPTWLGGEGKTLDMGGIWTAFKQGMTDGKKYVTDFVSDVSAEAVKKAQARIRDEAGKGPKADRKSQGILDSAEKQLTETQNQIKMQRELNSAVAAGTITVEQANQKLQIQNQLKSVQAERDKAEGPLKEKLIIIYDKLATSLGVLNEINRETMLQAANSGGAEQIAFLERQLELVGATNREREVGLAVFKAEQELKSGKFGEYNAAAPTDQQQTYIDNAKRQAEATNDLAVATQNWNSELSQTALLMEQIHDSGMRATANLGQTFGKFGEGVGRAVNALTNYRASQSGLAVEQDKLNKRQKEGENVTKEQIALTMKKRDADFDYYGDTISAAKGMFDEKSAGYKALQAVEMVYNGIRLANSIAQISADMAGAAATVTASGVKTAAYATETSAGVAAGAANIFAQLGPWGFPVVAAMVGVMATLGFGGGGGGGASVPAVDIAKERQATQGAGSVLGDANAKSESISKSLDIISKNTNSDLQYSNQMLTSLRGIEGGIESLTGLLARQLSVGGMFDVGGLGLGTTSSQGLLGSIPILGGLFGGGSKTTTELLDQGINIAATSVGNAIAGAINANAYQTTKSTTEKQGSFFGLFGGGTSSSTSTKNTSLGGDFTGEISSIVGGLRNTVLDAATKLGIEGAGAVIDSLSVNIGNISFKDMTGAEIKDELNAVFSKLGDEMVAATFPQVQRMQKVGEGALETLARLMAEYTAVDNAMKMLGMTFNGTGLSSIEARSRLVELTGGLDEFVSKSAFFVDNFISGAAAMAPIAKAVNAEMDRLGATGITTKEQFAALVQALDVSTERGAQLYAALMDVAPAFAKVADAATELADQQLDRQIKLLSLQGKELEATAMQRERELKALDATLRPLQKLIYATEDLNAASEAAATAQAKLDELLGKGATAAETATNAHNDLAKAYAAENNAAVAAVAAARQDLVNAYNKEASALQTTIDKTAQFVKSLADYRATLDNGNEGSGNAGRNYTLARQDFFATAAKAQAGDLDAMGNLQSAGNAFIAASKNVSPTAAAFNRDLLAVKNAVSATAEVAKTQSTVAEQQLAALKDSVAGLDIVAKNVLSVQQAITNYAAANQVKTLLDASVAGYGILNESVLSVRQAIDNLTVAQAAADAERNAAIAKARQELATAQTAKETAAAVVAALATGGIIAAAPVNDNAVATAIANANVPAPPVTTVTAPVTTNAAQSEQDAIDRAWQMGFGDSDPAMMANNSVYQWLASRGFPQPSWNLPQHATGLANVPHNNYQASLHIGERVLTAQENREYNKGGGENNNAELVAEVRAMRQQLAQLNTIAANTGDAARILKNVTPDGDSVQTKEAA